MRNPASMSIVSAIYFDYFTVSKPRDIDRIALKFDRRLGSAAPDVPVKFQSDWESESLNPNLATSRLHEILQ